MATTDGKRTFIIGSRASKLAQVQTYSIQAALSAAHPSESFDVAFMLTGGDKNKVDPLYLFGAAGKALWTEELEAALLKDRTIDFIVHSLKDMPTTLPEGAELGAIVERHDPLDSLVVKSGLEYRTLEDLPDGSVVGTSSIRRVAQLRRAFPKLVFSDMRGNIDTRLAKLDAPDSIFTAIVLAHAGLERMNLEHRVSSDIVPPHLYHSVGQGALGIEIRSDDDDARRLLSVLSHTPTEMRCRAERSCLRVLEGGCSVPVGVETLYSEVTESQAPSPSATIAYLDAINSEAPSPVSPATPASTNVDSYPTLTLTGSVTSLDGSEQVVFTTTAPMTCYADADALGQLVAERLVENGARTILEEVNRERAIRDAARKETKMSKADKGLSLPASIAGQAAAPSEKAVESAIDSATANPDVETSMDNGSNVPFSVEQDGGALAFLPPGHPPIPGSPSAALHAHQPGFMHAHAAPPTIPLPSSTIDDATPLLPAEHPPILVTPSKDSSAPLPTSCLRPTSPAPVRVKGGRELREVSASEAKKARDDGVCLRPDVEEVASSIGRKRKSMNGPDEEDAEGEVEDEVEEGHKGKRRAIALEDGRRRDMQG